MQSDRSSNNTAALSSKTEVIQSIAKLKTEFLPAITAVKNDQTRQIQNSDKKFYFGLEKKKKKNALLISLVNLFGQLTKDSDIALFGQLNDTLSKLWAIEYPKGKYSKVTAFSSRTKKAIDAHFQNLQNLKTKLTLLSSESTKPIQKNRVPDSVELVDSESVVHGANDGQDDGETKIAEKVLVGEGSILIDSSFFQASNAAMDDDIDPVQKEIDLQLESAIFITIKNTLKIPEDFSSLGVFDSKNFFRWSLKQKVLTIRDDNSKTKTILAYILRLQTIDENQRCNLLCLCLQDTDMFFGKLHPSFDYLYQTVNIFSVENQDKIVNCLMQVQGLMTDEGYFAFTVSDGVNPYSQHLIAFKNIHENSRKTTFLKLLPFYTGALKTLSEYSLSFETFSKYLERYTASTPEELSWDDFVFVAQCLLRRGSEIVGFSATGEAVEEKAKIVGLLFSLYHKLLISLEQRQDELIKKLCTPDPVISVVRNFIIDFHKKEEKLITANYSEVPRFLKFLNDLARAPIFQAHNDSSRRRSSIIGLRK